MLNVDLLWVWSVCGMSIIQPTATVILSPAPSRNPLTGLKGQISGCGCILMTGSHCWRCWIALYMYKEDLLWVWSVWGVWGLNHKNKQRPTSYTNNIHTQVPESKYQGVAASLWPVATVEGAELHYICIKKTCYEYEVCVGGVSIIRTNRDPRLVPTTSTLRS